MTENPAGERRSQLAAACYRSADCDDFPTAGRRCQMPARQSAGCDYFPTADRCCQMPAGQRAFSFLSFGLQKLLLLVEANGLALHVFAFLFVPTTLFQVVEVPKAVDAVPFPLVVVPVVGVDCVEVLVRVLVKLQGLGLLMLLKGSGLRVVETLQWLRV